MVRLVGSTDDSISDSSSYFKGKQIVTEEFVYLFYKYSSYVLVVELACPARL